MTHLGLPRVWALAALWLLASCAGSQAGVEASGQTDLGEPLQFTFGTLEGGELSSDTTRGRTTALLFATTYDLPSQAEAQLLRDVVATHRPLANAAVVMLEPPQSAPLVQVWQSSIRLRLPVAMATPSLFAGESQLGRITGVPSLLVLDRRGRLVSRSEGGLTREQISQLLRSADQH